MINFLKKMNKPSFAYLLVLVLSICAYNSVYSFFRSRINYGDIIVGVLAIFATASIIFIPAWFLRKNLRLYVVLLLPAFLIIPFGFASFIVFNVPFDEGTILLMMHTNWSETSELLGSYWFFLGVYLAIYLFILYLLVHRVPRRVSAGRAKWLSLCSLAVFILVPLGYPNKAMSYGQKLKSVLYLSYPLNFLHIGKNIYAEEHLVKVTETIRRNFTFSARQDISIKEDQVHILIIGESSRYDHWGINGYARNTSPRLEKRSDLISFSHAGAGGYITELAVPLLLTGVGAQRFESNISQKGVVGLFDEIGFKTWWLTDQTDMGDIRIHALEAQTQYSLLSDDRATRNVQRDMVLVGELQKVLSEPGSRKFIVLHTMGSHFSYSSRYPDEFDVFQPSNKTVSSQPLDRKFRNVLVNSYDNSILYSDEVIDSIISLVSRRNVFSTVTFMSDHGEDLLDDDKNLCMHASPVPSRFVAHIPYFIWYSPQLEKAYPGSIANLKRHKDAPVSSVNLIYTLTGMIGIHYPALDPKLDIADSLFAGNPQFMLGGDSVYKAAALE